MTRVAADDGELDLNDSVDLRTGPAIHDDLLALLPLVGVWSGSGRSATAAGDTIVFAEQIVFGHDGRAFLFYDARRWTVDAVGRPVRPAGREAAFWRPDDDDPDGLTVSISTPTAAFTISGHSGDQRWELTGERERRLYALVDDALVYVREVSVDGNSWTAEAEGRLSRQH
ncbi:MAG: FABP family protein [Janthinobacterium lividum]